MDAKRSALEAVDGRATELIDLSHRIHANPELKFEEVQSSAWCAEALSDAGLAVETGICELPTAFSATAGSGPLTIAICAEYDALPGIGHACGHNVIAACAVGAGIALAPLADDLGITVRVLGTPAEEGGGGKILMLERGGFDGVHAAMMVHPAPIEAIHMPCLAVAHVDVHFYGKEAHAAGFPELGINAADAITIAQTAIGLLRQHISPEARIHGIVTKGGEAANVVPGHTIGEWFIRHNTLGELTDLEPRVYRCFEAGALATGCTHEVVPQSAPYSEFNYDAEIAEVYRCNAEAIGRNFADEGAGGLMTASTDMANISLVMPAIHPTLGLGTFPVSNHQPEFASYCATPTADQAVRDGAAAMAHTVIDLATDGAIRDRLLSKAGA